MNLPRLALVVLVAVAVTSPAAAAHAIAYNTGIPEGYQVKFTYGNLYEPVSTFQKTGIDVGVHDSHGNPITGLEGVDATGKPRADPPIHVELVLGEQRLDMTGGLVQQTDRPGWYTYPITYSKTGTYKLHLFGLVNGTNVDINIQPAHAITDSTSSMWPAKVTNEETQGAEIAQLKQEVADLKTTVADLQASKKAAGFDASSLIFAVLGLAGLAAVRRSRAA